MHQRYSMPNRAEHPPPHLCNEFLAQDTRSVFYDIADTPEEAANLTARSLLMIAIEQRIKEKGWTQSRAAEILHVNQPRVSDLMNGKLSKFSLDALVNMLPAVGLNFDVRPIDTPDV
jgi:predicted XRE-type DNA-binding protein